MTMYDDERVVTLLREVDLPAAPPDRLIQVGRRARARESRLMRILAGVLVLVLVGGVFGVVALRGDDGAQVLTVAGAAQSTSDAGTARVTIRIDFASLQASLPAGAALPKNPHLSGLVDFVHERFNLRGNITGEPMEQRGIGKDRWQRFGGGKWEHFTETSSGEGFDQVDPSKLLAQLTSRGKTLSTSRQGDRTVFRIRAPHDLFTEGGPDGESIDVRVEVDAAQRVRELSYTEGQPGAGTMSLTMTFDDFGIDVDVKPPPKDQVVERSSSGGSSGSGSVESESGSVVVQGGVADMPPEQACETVKMLERQTAAMTDKSQKKAFERMMADLRKQCTKR